LGVRFLIGRAGTGKSAACAEEIRAAMGRDPLGGALLWVTPEQGTFTAERMLFAGGSGKSGGGHGAFRAQVLGFRRMAALIGREVGFLESERVKPLGDLARVVLLEEMVRGVRGELKVFGGVAERAGFIEKLDETLRELRQYGHSGESLRKLMEGAGGGGVDGISAGKLGDLAVLLDAWNGAMSGASAVWDVEKMLEHAALRMGESRWICGGEGIEKAKVWVDGFSAMSALEVRLLVALGKCAGEVVVTVEADPDGRAIRELRCSPEEMGVFGRTERLYCRLMEVLGKEKVRVGGTKGLRRAHRFQGELLRRIEREMFVDGKSTAEIAEDAEKRGEVGRGQESLFAGDAVEIWECSDPETEVRAAAQAVRELVVGGGMRYREVGVIVPDLEGYGDAIGRVFAEHRIPYFIDQRRSVAHHPMVELLRSAVAIRASRWDRDEVLLYVKTGLAGVDAEDVAVVENYLIGHGITRVSWEVPWRWVAPSQTEEERETEAPEHARALLLRVNAVREKVWGDLRGWMEAGGGANFMEGLRGLLERLKVGEQIKEWMEVARVAGDPELMQMHQQVWRQVQELLVMLEGLLVGRERTLAEFSAILEGALGTLTLGLVPPTVDQVLVSSVTRSRVPELRVALVLGAVEGQFPKVGEEDAILSDAQRALFNREGELGIGEGAERQLMEMPFFDYQALTRASEKLVLSYPVADRRGRAVGRSRHVGRLRELLGGEVVERRFDAGCRTEIERMGTVEDVLTSVVTWTRDVLRRRKETLEGSAADARMAGVYNWLVGDETMAVARELVWASVGERPAPRLSEAMAHRFYPPKRDLRMSVSQLEKYAACPLQYFMHYTLGLRPREILEMDTLNMGVLYHRILEQVYRRIMAKEGALAEWPGCAEEVLRGVVEEETEKASAELHKELAERTPAYEKTKERTKRMLGIVVEGQRRRALAGDLRPIGVEVNFGERAERKKEGRLSLPVLRIESTGGAAVALNGKIDRVDAGSNERIVAVVDYKSASEKKLELHLVYWGLTLQLPVYAVVMEILGEREAMAALYVPLGLRREKVKRLQEAAARESDGFYQRQKPGGIVDAREASHLDNEFVPEEKKPTKSPWYGMSLNVGGIVPKRGGLLEHGDFETVLGYVRWKIGAMGEELMRGEIGPAPYREKLDSACERCDFSSLCPFDRVAGVYREVPRMGREEAVERMRAAMAGDAN
jgi:ATP-dependent helicase/nuclease subunit B